jgi:hypothetical protein
MRTPTSIRAVPETLSPDAFEAELQSYLRDRAEESRAVRVGLRTSLNTATIASRYAVLFLPAQLQCLREAEAAADSPDRERLHLLRTNCESGAAESAVAHLADEVENAIAMTTVRFSEEELPLRAAQALLARVESYDARETLGHSEHTANETLNASRLRWLFAREQAHAQVTGELDPIARHGSEKQVDLTFLHSLLLGVAESTRPHYNYLRDRWLSRLLPDAGTEDPTVSHLPFLRRLPSYAETYTQQRCLDVCLQSMRALGLDLENMPGVHLDLEDRPQKNPRACVFATDPPKAVYLVTRPQGGIADYAAFLHEAGHASHYGSVDPYLPYAYRRLSRDSALTEIYAYVCEAIVREPGWHAQYFGLTDNEADDVAEGALFLESLRFRRNTAKLGFELVLWPKLHESAADEAACLYASLLTASTGFVHYASAYLSDTDVDFYSADYLRACVRSAQVRTHLRAEVGADWWRAPETGRFLLELFALGTGVSNESVAERIGFDALDMTALIAELRAGSENHRFA